jgi:hypothetical protein
MLHRKTDKRSKTREWVIVCCGPICQFGCRIWPAACFGFGRPAAVWFLVGKTIANCNYATYEYFVRCLVSDLQVTVKWRKPSSDETMAAEYLQYVFEVAILNFSFQGTRIYLQTGYPVWGFCGLPHCLQTCAEIKLQLVHGRFLSHLSNSLFINHPVIQHYMSIYTPTHLSHYESIFYNLDALCFCEVQVETGGGGGKPTLRRGRGFLGISEKPR